jgi:hypothetical protein
MDLRTASERQESHHQHRPGGRLHAYAPGMIQTLCGWSLVGSVLPLHQVRWGENPGGLAVCGECANVATVL